ncbi:MAG: hypothetical protein NC489_46690, partial [Ruminococcus flavefaciens]|nr:hypothetical protein [Ruminococcus flavefaciens]
PLTLSNSWTVTNGGGDYSYTVPYSGIYEITLAGGQGGDYNDNSGGYGQTVVKKLRLQAGTALTIHNGRKASAYTTNSNTLTVQKGDASYVDISGVGKLIAGAGGGYVNYSTAPNSITSVQFYDGNANLKTLNVHWHTSNNVSYANRASHSNSFPLVYSLTNQGGCYRGSHTHDALSSCPWRYTYHEHDGCSYTDADTVHCTSRSNGMSYFRCSACGANYSHYDGGASTGWGWGPCGCSLSRTYHCDGTPNRGHEYTCGGSPINTWTIGCGYSQGQILGFSTSNSPAGDCALHDSKNANRAGDGYCTIKLIEQDPLYFKDTKVKAPYYLDGKCNLIIQDDTVVYFKRP